MGGQVGGRVFLVGCARSGTTLLQALLAAHPSIASFPETQFFSVLIGQAKERIYGAAQDKDGLLRNVLKNMRLWAGIAYPRAGRAQDRVNKLLAEVGYREQIQRHPSRRLTLRASTKAFQRILDELTLRQNKNLWLEKSPNHLYYINEIERYVDEPRFIHLIRKGQDVVASIYDAAQKFTGGHDFKADMDECIARWNSAVTITRHMEGRHNHLVVHYENLVANTEQELRRIVDFIGIPYDERMLNDYVSSAKSLVRDTEQWKSSVSETIQTQRGEKFFELFDEKTRSHILTRLVDGHEPDE